MVANTTKATKTMLLAFLLLMLMEDTRADDKELCENIHDDCGKCLNNYFSEWTYKTKEGLAGLFGYGDDVEKTGGKNPKCGRFAIFTNLLSAFAHSHTHTQIMTRWRVA